MATLSPTEVGFYPTQDYLVPTQRNKNTPWAAMKVPMDSFRALAESQAIAEEKGLLSPETTKYYLASALKEGRWEDYGVNEVPLNYTTAPPANIAKNIAASADYDRQREILDKYVSNKPFEESTALRARFNPTLTALRDEGEKLKVGGYPDKAWSPGPTYKKLRSFADALGLDDPTSEEIDKGAKYGVYRPMMFNSELDTPENIKNGYRRNAAIKTLALINKVHESGLEGLKAWERYNGAGPDARKYRRQIEAIHENLSHEKNKDMVAAYNNLVNQYRLEIRHGKR